MPKDDKRGGDIQTLAPGGRGQGEGEGGREAPHRFSRRLTAWLRRLPLKWGRGVGGALTGADFGYLRLAGGRGRFLSGADDDTGRAAGLDGCTHGCGGAAGAKGLREQDARPPVALRRHESQRTLTQDVRQGAGQGRPGTDRVGMLLERPELHHVPRDRAGRPACGRSLWLLRRGLPRHRLPRRRGVLMDGGLRPARPRLLARGPMLGGQR